MRALDFLNWPNPSGMGNNIKTLAPVYQITWCTSQNVVILIFILYSTRFRTYRNLQCNTHFHDSRELFEEWNTLPASLTLSLSLFMICKYSACGFELSGTRFHFSLHCSYNSSGSCKFSLILPLTVCLHIQNFLLDLWSMHYFNIIRGVFIKYQTFGRHKFIYWFGGTKP
jgi:hypothetical protein